MQPDIQKFLNTQLTPLKTLKDVLFDVEYPVSKFINSYTFEQILEVSKINKILEELNYDKVKLTYK